MVNPGSFQGARRQFLEDEKEGYIQAAVDGVLPDRLADIQRRFFKRFPIDRGDDYEPTADELAAVDDDAPDAEPAAPDETKMSVEAFAKAKEEFKARRTKITFRRDVSGHVPYDRETNNRRLTPFRSTANQTMAQVSFERMH